MDNLFSNNIKPAKALLLTAVSSLAGFFIFLFVGVLVNGMVMGNFSLDTLTQADTTSSEGLMSLRIMQIFQSIGLFLFPAFAMAIILQKNFLSFLGFYRTPLRFMAVAIVLMFVAIPGINLLASINAEVPMPQWMIDMERQTETLVKAMLVTDKPSLFLLNLFVVAIIPAVVEELFFRSLLQKFLIHWTRSTLLGILLAAFIFSAIHMQFQGFLPRFVLGLLFGYLYVWSGSIWTPIAVHFVNNGLAVTLYYFMAKGSVNTDIETVGDMSGLWYIGLVSILASAILAHYLWQSRVKPQLLSGSAQASQDL